MYLSHYNLKEKPFQISTDPKFIWFSANHQEALAVLEYGVIDNKGFLLITGDVGTGKTTLINTLLTRLGNDVVVANITNPILEELDFFNIIANEFNINKEFSSKAEFSIHFGRFLHDCYTKKKKVVLVVDEAHKLSQNLLEQIRLLSNIERADTKLITIFFVGQNEFINIISSQENRALRQRITINYHLEPLSESEVKAYILHRLKVAGLTENIFNDNSICEIIAFSKGYPRLINIICDHALLTGYVREVKIIDEEIIKECANALFVTKENNDNSKNDLKPTREEIPAAKAEPEITPIDYTNRYNLPEQRLEHRQNNPKAAESMPHQFSKEPASKLSGKRFRYLSAAAIVLIALGLLYYPTNLGGYIKNIKNYFNPAPNTQEQAAFADIPRNTASHIKIDPAIRGSDKSGDAPFNSTHPAAGNDSLPIAEKKNIKGLLKEDRIKKFPVVADVNPKKISDKTYKFQNVSEHESAAPREYTIYFDYNSYNLSDKNLQMLKQISGLLAQHPKAGVVVKGYTDAEGNVEYNKKLSELRARSIKSYFVDHGINFSRIKTLGMGQKNPKGSNKTSEGRSRNRRVEIELNFNKT
ncbi:MAG: OmpA family protein [Desulfobacterales bacterium]